MGFRFIQSADDSLTAFHEGFTVAFLAEQQFMISACCLAAASKSAVGIEVIERTRAMARCEQAVEQASFTHDHVLAEIERAAGNKALAARKLRVSRDSTTVNQQDLRTADWLRLEIDECSICGR